MDILSGIQKKVYAVIEFTTEGEVEIVASKWLFLTNKTQLNVYWPPGPSFETRRMCINQNQPIPGVWKIFEVQIIHITDDYEQARSVLTDRQYLSDISMFPGSEAKKQKIVQPNLFQKNLGVSTEQLQPSNQSFSSYCENFEVDTILAKNSQLLSDNATTNKKPPVIELSHAAQDSSEIFLEKPQWLLQIEEEIYGIRIDLLKLQQDMQTNRNLLERIFNSFDANALKKVEDVVENLPEVLPPLPVDTIENFNKIEEELQNHNIRRQLVKHLLRFKNGNVQQTAKCVLSALLTDNLMLNFSWLGQRGKSSMHQCNVVKVIVDVIRTSFPASEIDYKDIKEAIQNYLRYTDKRIKGKSRRNSEVTLGHVSNIGV